MDQQLQKINDLYQKIGLDQNGQPYDRPPKTYPIEEPISYGYSSNSLIPPSYIKNIENRGV